MVNGLGAQLGAWEKFESSKAGVISYFHKAFYKTFIDSGMKDHALELLKQHPGFRVWVRLVTFGEPRTGNVAFAKEIEENIQFRYRVVKKNDFITSIPRSVDPTTSLVTATLFERQPLFYRYLVHYNNDMEKGDDFSVCELSDDFGCRNTNLAYDLSDHQNYFDLDTDEFVNSGCPRDQLL
ncbi:triacylglycerol lipase [Ancylostoma duodenale]|uniref:Triacylglycerol lipase n=1 Tax=Ancylostoma duodenale TaxID=51022 RepID=A0A0C2HAX0_9BILA|nr:triacylglycerol lipase [Ancylostoma duodenale]